ncbi:MAG: MerR family transcriptional regulator [Rhodobiaceae bacterium]|nr:MerR family transcriptional regulator [Rhodobiaceae bacterium]MCC0052689.1 MerR family transcriptional regulator [Rhodobiaceae bacterium]
MALRGRQSTRPEAGTDESDYGNPAIRVCGKKTNAFASACAPAFGGIAGLTHYLALREIACCVGSENRRGNKLTRTMYKPEPPLDGCEGNANLDHTISELAERFGVTMRTLRFYEEKGLLKPNRRGNRRLYSMQDVHVLSDIVRMKEMGLSITCIQSIMKTVRSGNVETARSRLLSEAQMRLVDIDKEMEFLRIAQDAAQRAAEDISAGERWFKSA